MPDAGELIRKGDLGGARAALVEEVRANPGDMRPRMFLSQVLCVLGEWDKAEAHLRAMASAEAPAMMLQKTLSQVIAAERVREDVFAGRVAMPVLVDSPAPWVASLTAALEAEHKGDLAAAGAMRAQAFEDSPETPGTADGTAFTFITDADARFGPCLEAIIDGQYGLIPFEAVAALQSAGPADLRDLVWQPVGLTLRSGRNGMAFLPARYPGAAGDPDDLVRLARKTEWQNRPGLGPAGRGQRVFDADGTEIALLSLRRIDFAA
jgi:type VI secretion system protein ImpE